MRDVPGIVDLESLLKPFLAFLFEFTDLRLELVLRLFPFLLGLLIVLRWNPEYANWLGSEGVSIWEDLRGLDKVGESHEVFKLLLVAHLFVEDYQLPLDIASLCQFAGEFVLDLTELLLLEHVRVLLQLLCHLLLHHNLLLDLSKCQASMGLRCVCLFQGQSWPSQGV